MSCCVHVVRVRECGHVCVCSLLCSCERVVRVRFVFVVVLVSCCVSVHV